MAARECVVITTYARPDALERLLGDLEREAPPAGLDVRVYDDATPRLGDAIPARIAANGWTYRRAEARHGKEGFWRWWNVILADLRATRAERFLLLQDDMRLCRDFLARAAAVWDAIPEPAPASLVLHLTAERARLGSRCWTPVRAEAAGSAVHCGWLDLAAVICARRLFAALDWRLDAVDARRWRRDPLRSSGVGEQLSVRAHAHGLRMYRVWRSLAVHDGRPSLMNAPARRRWTMDTVAYADGDDAARALTAPRPRVFASVASVPPREAGLRRVVGALLEQVDALGVYLNGYGHVPAFLADERVRVARSQDHGDRGDAGKFFWAAAPDEYHLTCDDDLDYPADYVERLVAGIERHGRAAVAGFHGRVLAETAPDYRRPRALLHFSRRLGADTAVHVLGTGVAGYHAGTLTVMASDFPEPNMADVWLAVLAQRRRVPLVCLAHEHGWLRELPGFRRDSIWVRAGRPGAAGTPSRESVALRAHAPLTLHGAAGTIAAAPRAGRPRPAPPPRASRPLVRVSVAGPRRRARLVLPAEDHITEAIRRSGTYYERDLLDAIRAIGARGTFVDVGAHFGNHTTYFALECEAAHVLAIEPNPPAHLGLLETIAENDLRDRVTAHKVAAHPRWRRVHVTPLPWRPPASAPRRTNSGRVGVVRATGAGDAPAAPLDELLDGIEHVAVIKVAAEGMSAEVLASGERTLRRDRPLVAAEAGSPRERAAVGAVLGSLGYRELAPPYTWTPTWLWAPVDRRPPRRSPVR